MDVIGSYLSRINHAIQKNNARTVRSLAKEIEGAFAGQIEHINFYERDENGPTVLGLKQLRGKLLNLRNEKDQERYGSFGLSSLTESIHELEDLSTSAFKDADASVLCKKVDSLYANSCPDYLNGIKGWGNQIPGGELKAQLALRCEKLKAYRDMEQRKLLASQASGSNITMTQSSEHSSSAVANSSSFVTIEMTFEQIDGLPETSLSEEEKTQLKGMIGDLNTKDDEKRTGKLQKLLSWLSNKGTDIFIAAMPYVVEYVKSKLGM